MTSSKRPSRTASKAFARRPRREHRHPQDADGLCAGPAGQRASRQARCLQRASRGGAPEDRRCHRGLQQELEATLRNVPSLEKGRRSKIRKLNSELAKLVVGLSIKDAVVQFENHAEVKSYLEKVRADLIANAELFLQSTREDEESAFGGAARLLAKHPLFARYGVNVVVSHALGGSGRAPVVFEEHPSLPRLFGRIDHRSMMGTLVTDFTLIKPGALHLANGGYLVLDALRVLHEPMAWDALKSAVCARKKIETTSSADELGVSAAETLVPIQFRSASRWS